MSRKTADELYFFFCAEILYKPLEKLKQYSFGLIQIHGTAKLK